MQLTGRRSSLGLVLGRVAGVLVMPLRLLLLLLLAIWLMCVAQMPGMCIGVLNSGMGAILGSDDHQPTLHTRVE